MTKPTGSRRVAFWAALLVLLALGSVVYPKLGLPAAFFSFIGALALPTKDKPSTKLKLTLILSALASAIGLVRFVVQEAVPGIVQGGRQAVRAKAVSRLREIVSAQDVLRRRALVDPDHDGIGSAARVGELCGKDPLRGALPLEVPALACRGLVPTALGPADDSGAYLHIVCLPAAGGGWTAEPGVAVDEEQAERRFLAYAWPAAHSDFTTAFFSDEHERILEKALPAAAASAAELRCDAALSEPGWSVWMGKQPRAILPGDRGP